MKRVESVSCLWTGDQQAYLDQPSSKRIRHVTVGRYGGCTEGGACKNEDGFLLWLGEAEGLGVRRDCGRAQLLSKRGIDSGDASASRKLRPRHTPSAAEEGGRQDRAMGAGYLSIG